MEVHEEDRGSSVFLMGPASSGGFVSSVVAE